MANVKPVSHTAKPAVAVVPPKPVTVEAALASLGKALLTGGGNSAEKDFLTWLEEYEKK